MFGQAFVWREAFRMTFLDAETYNTRRLYERQGGFRSPLVEWA